MMKTDQQQIHNFNLYKLFLQSKFLGRHLMGACVSVQKRSSQTNDNPLFKLFSKSSDTDTDHTNLISKQKNALKLIYQDLAQRSGNGQLNSRIFEQFFNLNKLWGSALFRKFSEDKANHYDSSITLTEQQFVDKIQKIYSSGLNQKLKFLFSIYDLDDSKGVSQRQFVAILIGSPQQQIRQLLCEDEFLQSLSVSQIAYILSNETESLINKNSKPVKGNLLQSSSYLSLIKLPHQQKKYSNQIQLGLPQQECQSLSTSQQQKSQNNFLYDNEVKQQIKAIIRNLKCVTILVRAYARYVFKKEGINDSKSQIKFQNFRKIVLKYPIIFQACFQGFHEYLWRYKLGQPIYKSTKTKIASKCEYIKKNKQKKIYLKYIQTSFLLFEDSSEEDLLQIINLQGLNLSRIKDKQLFGFKLSHQSGVYPQKQFYFKNKQILQKWLQLTMDYQQNDILQSYDIMQLIDKGRYGNVHRCKDKKTNEIKAVKIINKYLLSQNQRSALDSQLQILKACEQFNVVQAYSTYETKNNLYIVMEYLNDGTLYDYIKLKNKKYLQEEQAKHIMKKLLQTVSQLHSIGIIHRDLKLNNVMIKYEDKQVVPIIIDFGIAIYKVDMNKISEQRRFIGCANFIAPQVYNHEQFDEKIDVFSLGVIMYYLLCGYLPFDSFDTTVIRQSVCACQVQFTHTRWKKVSKQAKKLILKMLCFKEDRISCEEALKDEWFVGEEKSPTLKKKMSADV